MSYSPEFRLALYSLEGVGPATYHKILNFLQEQELTERDFWRNTGQSWSKLSLEKKTLESIKNFKKEYTSYSYWQAVEGKQLRVIFTEDDEYPALLKEITNPPPMLFARGAELTGKEHFLSVVGSRKMTEYGQQAIGELIPPLVELGKTIVSGFMYGVDVTAQRLALDSGGKTVGVLGFGFDDMYPQSHRRVMTEFLERGATFLSPFAPHVAAVPGNFPARNAVVAGMSEGVLVIEAAERSGSLITARLAGEFGRDIWVVPGSIFSQNSVGATSLINQGAKLVINARDVAELAYVGDYQEKLRARWRDLAEERQQLCELLLQRPLPVDELARQLTLSIPQTSTILIELELLGLVEQAGHQWRLQA